MCKYEKKYKEYKVFVNFDNEKSCEYKNSRVDKRSWREMVNLYSEAKDKYKESKYIQSVNLIGITSKGERCIIYQKENIGSKTNKIDKIDNQIRSTNNKPEILKNVDEIENIDDFYTKTKQTLNNLNQLLELQDKISKMTSLFDKQQDTLLHKIETLKDLHDDGVISDENYLENRNKFYNILEECRENRRKYKSMHSISVLLNNQIKPTKIVSKLNTTLKNLDEKINKEYNWLDNKFLDEKWREIDYIDESDKVCKINQLKTKYKKVVDFNNKIYAYNTIY